jgi:hypothetical protein
VFLVGGNIMVAILEVAALYLQFGPAAAAPADDEESTGASDMEKEEGIGAAGIILVVLDAVVISLAYSAMAATYSEAKAYRGQIGACPGFTGQVLKDPGARRLRLHHACHCRQGRAAPVQRAAAPKIGSILFLCS